MKTIIRKHYQLMGNAPQGSLSETALAAAKKKASAAIQAEILETLALFRDEDRFYLYLEAISEAPDEELSASVSPQQLLAPLAESLAGAWQEMPLVYAFAFPESLTEWRRQKRPDERAARIAHLHPEKRASYLTHHHNIVAEGVMPGDKYQAIAHADNILFSYFETPRDRYITNVSRSDSSESAALAAWLAVDPESHFIHGEKNPVDNFYVIETLLDIGHGD